MIDLTGKRFGMLTVIRRNGSIDGNVAWLCKCDCGTLATYRGNTLRNGMTKSCGCNKAKRISEAQREDLTGKQFGYLIVEYLDSIAKNRQCKWKCRCLLCNGTTIVYASNLKRKHTISCGCLATSENETNLDIVLRNKGINYSHGFQFSDLIGPNGGYLEFDFALKDNDNNLLALVEYQGEQHYREMPNDKHFGQIQREYTDKQKRKYCNDHKIPLYEIRFDEDILDKIDSILSQVYSHVDAVPSPNGKV